MKSFSFKRNSAAALMTLAGLFASAAHAETYNITVDKVKIDTGDFVKDGIGYNGSSPGPVLRFKEGEDVTINVTNNLTEDTSIHWHGLILPYQEDGVPGISFDGIKPGETFTYNFPIVQSGTYWFHSHSGFQEPDGAYGAIVIEPKDREPFKYDREYVVQLTDKHPHSGDRIMRNLKMMPDYYNRQQQTLFDFFNDADENGLADTVNDRMAWGDMRMMPADVEDLQGFTPLINGKSAAGNWTGLFKPGERVRLRFINSSAMTYFDIKIPGLEMTVVAADGNNVQPVKVDEFRIAVAETYDVIVQPKEDKAYTIFAASMGRSAYGRGTLATKEGMSAEVPELEERPLLTMADMGMNHANMSGMDHSSMSNDSGVDHAAMGHGDMMAKADEEDHSAHNNMSQEVDHAAMGHTMPKATDAVDPFYAQGSGIMPKASNGGKFLSYSDLKAQKPLYEYREATREIELRLTGNMERYVWSINGKKYEDEEEIKLNFGERVRFKFVNETMMSHPMHLHGMWSILDVGAGKWNPVKHTISIAPGTTVYMETEVDAEGEWAFHCHLSYHASAGMFRRVVVEKDEQVTLQLENNL
ncbi:copper resistance system multicopper oxidase [Curvivirga sp.]|uniref:copper resistance system multicopper oxidase n=1 Tax=Curvivirga sp. TaxID=2856848 RepID=UPI003B59A6DC